MADAKKCDICGKFYIPPLGIDLTRNTYSLYYNNLIITNSGFYDLCPNCNGKLNDFVKSMMAENKKGA